MQLLMALMRHTKKHRLSVPFMIHENSQIWHNATACMPKPYYCLFITEYLDDICYVRSFPGYYAGMVNNTIYIWKSAQRRRKHCALAIVRRTHKQTHRQGRLQYTAQLSAQLMHITATVSYTAYIITRALDGAKLYQSINQSINQSIDRRLLVWLKYNINVITKSTGA